jgi:hypothetical protein
MGPPSPRFDRHVKHLLLNAIATNINAAWQTQIAGIRQEFSLMVFCG